MPVSNENGYGRLFTQHRDVELDLRSAVSHTLDRSHAPIFGRDGNCLREVCCETTDRLVILFAKSPGNWGRPIGKSALNFHATQNRALVNGFRRFNFGGFVALTKPHPAS